MNKFIYLLLILLTYSFDLYSASPAISGFVKEKENSELPIVGANVYWKGTTKGTVTDKNGYFKLDYNETLSNNLIISFVGYNADTLSIKSKSDELLVLLEKNLELGEVTVSQRQPGAHLSKLNPIHTQKITSSELKKAACCNLSESFETNASVDVAYTDAVTGAQQIKLLGLSGIYVQTISENIPMMRGLAAPYGLGYTPGSWMESIQISKGTSSVINGYEAISGQINVEYKKPEGNELLHFNAYVNNTLKAEANLNASMELNDKLSSMVLLHAENFSSDIDEDTDGFIDIPHVRQINFINRWNLKSKDGGHKQIGIKILSENRKSGQRGAFDNPSANLYGININTNRYEIFAKNGIIFDKPGSSLGIQLSGSYHNQDALYGNKEYSGTQYNAYLNIIYQGYIKNDMHNYSVGTSFSGDIINETLQSNKFIHKEYVPGVFLQYNFKYHEHFNLLAGIRTDYSSVYGLFITPRVHAKWSPNDWLQIRGSAGKGYRTSVPLSENNYLLASSREIEIADNLKQEEALNYGISLTGHIPVGEKKIDITVDYFRTDFQNQIIRDTDKDPHKVSFYNLEGESFSNSFQTELLWEIFRGFTVNAAWRINDVKQTINGTLREIPLTSRYKGLLSLSYATRLNKWQFDVTGQFNGGGRMPDPDKTNPLWEKEFKPFNVYNLQITKNFKKWSIYAGAENLLNFSINHPVISADNPWGENFDGSMIWGPVHGRKIYAGIRYTLKSYK
jgi:outer membrane receptor for ferrienterochelin and colicin